MFWVDEKNTLAYTTTEYAAIGSEMGELPAFTEYDNDGNLYLKMKSIIFSKIFKFKP